MGSSSLSLSERLQRVARAIFSLPSAILNRVKPSEEHGAEYIYKDAIYEDYIAVMERLKVSRIGGYVERIRAKTRPHQEKVPVVEVGPPKLAYNQIYYRVRFADGVSWMLKIPMIGTPDQFDADEADELRSEALMMRMLRRETTIPIPEVFYFNNTCSNELKVPFLLMEFVEGHSLEDIWHDRKSPKEVVQARRTRCLQDIAAAYSQLGRYTFNESGALRFDSQERLVVATGKGTGSFTDPKKAYTGLLDRWEEQDTPAGRGTQKLLRMFIDWAPLKHGEGRPFVLTDANTHLSDFLVAEDGSLRAILNWHGTEIAPRSVGNEAYPRWLIRDWGSLYWWNEDMERGIHDERCKWEDSPATLEYYRKIYAQCIANLRPGSENAKLTRKSLLNQNLLLGADEPILATEVANRILLNLEKHLKANVHASALPAPLNISHQEKDGINSKQRLDSQEEAATGNSNSRNEAETDQGGDDSKSDDEERDERFDVHLITSALDNNTLSKSHENLLKTRFDAVVQSL